MDSQGQTKPPAVLVVDDNDDVREVMVGYLERHGVATVEAAGGEQALACLEAQPSICVVVSDVRMARMTGLELAGHIAERWPDVRVVLTSGYFESQAAGPRFLQKPFTMQQFLDLVQAELDTVDQRPR